MTLRQLFYRLVSAGEIANKPSDYRGLGVLMTRLREAGHVPRTWLVDHTRSTIKPSSWSGLADFGETVRDCYRKDFWASMPHHVEVFVEKDAVAGTVQPVTNENDVACGCAAGMPLFPSRARLPTSGRKSGSHLRLLSGRLRSVRI